MAPKLKSLKIPQNMISNHQKFDRSIYKILPGVCLSIIVVGKMSEEYELNNFSGSDSEVEDITYCYSSDLSPGDNFVRNYNIFKWKQRIPVK